MLSSLSSNPNAGVPATNSSSIGAASVLTDQVAAAFAARVMSSVNEAYNVSSVSSSSDMLVKKEWRKLRELGACWSKASSGVGIEEEEFSLAGDRYEHEGEDGASEIEDGSMESDSESEDEGEERMGDEHATARTIAYTEGSVGGHHFVRANIGMMDGLWAWTVTVEEDRQSDMHTLLGVCFEEVSQPKYDRSREMMLVAGWSGRVYREGQQLSDVRVQTFTVGDRITFLLDLRKAQIDNLGGTLSMAINGKNHGVVLD